MLLQWNHSVTAYAKRRPCQKHVILHVFAACVVVPLFCGAVLSRRGTVFMQVSRCSVALSSQAAFAGNFLHKPLALATTFSCRRKREHLLLPCCAAQHGNEADKSTDRNTLDALQFNRERLRRQWNAPQEQESELWATVEMNLLDDDLPKVGTVLLANPDIFLQDDLQEGTPTAALRRMGWTRQEDESKLSRRERARLPVVLIRHRDEAGIEGFYLDYWTYQLLGDLGFRAFETRPLYSGCGPRLQFKDEQHTLAMLHGYPEMPGAARIGEGLGCSDCSGDNFRQACDWVSPEGPGSALRFKFFCGSIRWSLSEAKRELTAQAGIWMPLRASTDFLLREPDSSFEEPLWVQLAERAGGHVAELARKHGLLAD